MQLRSAQLEGDCMVKVGDGPNLAGRAGHIPVTHVLKPLGS